MYINPYWSANTGASVCWSPLENVAYEFVLTFPYSAPHVLIILLKRCARWEVSSRTIVLWGASSKIFFKQYIAFLCNSLLAFSSFVSLFWLFVVVFLQEAKVVRLSSYFPYAEKAELNENDDVDADERNVSTFLTRKKSLEDATGSRDKILHTSELWWAGEYRAYKITERNIQNIQRKWHSYIFINMYILRNITRTHTHTHTLRGIYTWFIRI